MIPKRIPGRIALSIGLTLLALNSIEAATIHAASPLLGDVSQAVASAADGDTVIVPAGTAHWASCLTITKGITLIGGTTCDTSTPHGTANDQTIILDDNRTVLPSPNQIINITLSPNQVFRMSGFTFRGGTGNLSNAYAVFVGGTCPGASGTGSFRVDHCHFDGLNRNVDVQTGGWVYGVIDHSIFYGSGFAVNVHHDTWGGGSKNYGDGSWAEPAYFGSNKFVFIEDCCMSNVTGDTNGADGSFDAKAGGRFVIRHNFLNNTQIACHGTEAQRSRGGRAMEIYNNTFNFTYNWPGGQVRSGAAVIHDNVGTGSLNGIMLLQPYRAFSNMGAPWTSATGFNPWDSNDSHGAYETGTQTGVSSSTTLVDSSKNWTTDQWAPTSAGVFKVVNTHALKSDGSYWAAGITSNTKNTLTFPTGDQPNRTVVFNPGDTYAIYRVTAVVDQPGRGPGDLLAGGDTAPINSVTGTRLWPRNALEPVYSWNNTIRGSPSRVGGAVPLIEGRDYFNDTKMLGYTPYQYPHPLVSGASPNPTPPSAPQNLHVVGP